MATVSQRHNAAAVSFYKNKFASQWSAIHYHFTYEPTAVTRGFKSLHPTQHDVVIYIPWWSSQAKDYAPYPIVLFIVSAITSKTYFEQICDIQSDIINCTAHALCATLHLPTQQNGYLWLQVTSLSVLLATLFFVFTYSVFSVLLLVYYCCCH